ncbi:MAG TPA: hypothetical protein VGF14_08020 [Alphaproteobacteria bacterium]
MMYKPAPPSTIVSGQKREQSVVVSYPTNTLKQKLGNGGFEYQRLLKAEQRLRAARQEFPFIAQRELQKINSAVHYLKNPHETERPPIHWLRATFSAAVELKSNSGMFAYPIISTIADSLLYFTEHLKKSDPESTEIINLHYETLHLVFEQGHDVMTEEQRDELLGGLQSAILKHRNGPHSALH